MLINEFVVMNEHRNREEAQKTRYGNRAVTEVITEFKEQLRINKRKQRR